MTSHDHEDLRVRSDLGSFAIMDSADSAAIAYVGSGGA
jgi:hypothetical protein